MSEQIKKEPKSGRPRKQTEKRDTNLTFRCTQDQKQFIKRVADTSGVSVADLILKSVHLYDEIRGFFD